MHMYVQNYIVLNRYFLVCDGSLVPDIMHDVFEGALGYEVKLLLQHMIREKLFTLDEFNSRTKNMDLGYMEVKDRPSLITQTTLFSPSNKLKQEGVCVYVCVSVCVHVCVCVCVCVRVWAYVCV